jgi:hypothetical protein
VSRQHRRLAAASVISAAVVLAAPAMGQLRGLLRSAFPTHFVAIVGAMVAAGVMTAMVTALLRIKTRRGARYGALAAALAIGIGYSVASRSGVADVDAVEHFHFVEYGIITILFYRGWREHGDASAFVLPVLAGLLVATLDEWLQWFVPVRVGEMRDVLLDLVAICCGLLVGAAVEPPAEFSKRPRAAGSATSMCVAAATAVLVFAGFVNAVHLGYLVSVEKGTGEQAPGIFFRSHYTSERLDALAADRAARWRTDPPVVLKRYSQEDQYMEEGLWHIRRRNQDWAGGQYARAWQENLILERFFEPVLDTPSYALPVGGRWPAEQRADAERRAVDAAPFASASAGPFVSDAQPLPIFIWPRRLFWSAIAAVVFVALAWAYVLYPRKIV